MIYTEETAVEREIIISNTENDLDNLKDVEIGGLKIDKVIGNIEEQTISKASEDLGIAQYIDEAFRLKGLGDFEGAILYYMYALDKNPDKDAVFWIVLDTCVLYKELGQIGLAKEILESYVSSYGDLMDVAVRAEIESNLINI
jgi:tetratricopeptide (TPR) repeat protein